MAKTKYIANLMTVGLFSKLVGIPPDTLRRYDNIGILKPYEVCEHSGYRYYSPAQVTQAIMVRTLTELKVDDLAIKELADSLSPENLLVLLHRQTVKALELKEYADTVCSALQIHTSLLLEGISAKECKVSVERCSEMKFILCGQNDHSDAEKFYRELGKIYETRTKPPLNGIFPMGGYFKNMAEFITSSSQPANFISLDPRGHDVKESGLYMIGYARGYYGDVGDLPTRMEAFAAENGYEFDGPVYNVFLLDEMCIKEHNMYLAEVSASVRESSHAPSNRHNRMPNFK